MTKIAIVGEPIGLTFSSSYINALEQKGDIKPRTYYRLSLAPDIKEAVAKREISTDPIIVASDKIAFTADRKGWTECSGLIQEVNLN